MPWARNSPASPLMSAVSKKAWNWWNASANGQSAPPSSCYAPPCSRSRDTTPHHKAPAANEMDTIGVQKVINRCEVLLLLCLIPFCRDKGTVETPFDAAFRCRFHQRFPIVEWIAVIQHGLENGIGIRFGAICSQGIFIVHPGKDDDFGPGAVAEKRRNRPPPNFARNQWRRLVPSVFP